MYTDGAIAWSKKKGNKNTFKSCVYNASLAEPNNRILSRLFDLKVLLPGWEEQCDLGHTIIHTHRNCDAVKILLDLGLGINKKEICDYRNKGYTMLIKASQAGCDDIVRLLLSRNAELNCISDSENQTALHVAAKFCHSTIVQQLLLAGADPTLKDKDGNTARMLVRYWDCYGSDEKRKTILVLLGAYDAFNITIVARAYKPISADVWGKILSYFDFESAQKDNMLTYLAKKGFLCQ